MRSSDITAIVPTIGEKTFKDSIEHLKNQTLKPQEIIVVRNVMPIHKALNKGVEKVKTPFFIQCDADMLLDSDCLEVLRNSMKKQTGLAIGYLQDEILGPIQAVKMFRAECFKNNPFTDKVATDTDCISKIMDKGYEIVFARRKVTKYGHPPHVLGKHCPQYKNPLYVFEKFHLMGSVVCHRQAYDEFKGCLQALKKSQHPMADAALVAFCHGFFSRRIRDGHYPFKETKDFKIFKEFERKNNQENLIFAITKIKGFNPRKVLKCSSSN